MKYAGQTHNATLKDFGKIIQYKILTVITSARENFLLRSLLRDIMSLETSLEMSQHLFILGQGDKDENITIAKQLEEEIKEHDDIVIGNFKDDYEHLSMKTFTERIYENFIHGPSQRLNDFERVDIGSDVQEFSSIQRFRVIWRPRKDLRMIQPLAKCSFMMMTVLSRLTIE